MELVGHFQEELCRILPEIRCGSRMEIDLINVGKFKEQKNIFITD